LQTDEVFVDGGKKGVVVGAASHNTRRLCCETRVRPCFGALVIAAAEGPARTT
jgi:hypothetical protein